jgi:HSP20 family protein
MDVCETDNGYEVNVSLPGVKPEDIELTVQQNTLTVKGHYSYQNEHHNKHPEQGKPQQQGQHQSWLLREIGTGTFERTITFPKPINTENIQTNYENGLLSITVSISEASRPRRINISKGEGQPKQVTVESGS